MYFAKNRITEMAFAKKERRLYQSGRACAILKGSAA